VINNMTPEELIHYTLWKQDATPLELQLAVVLGIAMDRMKAMDDDLDTIAAARGIE